MLYVLLLNLWFTSPGRRGISNTISEFSNHIFRSVGVSSLHIKLQKVGWHLMFAPRYMVLDTTLRMERSEEYESRIQFWKSIAERLPST